MAAIIDYRGKTPTKTTSGVPLVTAKIVKGGRIEEPAEFIAEADFDAWMRRGMPNPGDIVMTTEAPLGEVAQLDGRKIALAQRVITLRGKPDLLDNTYLKFLLQSASVQEELLSRGTGTTVVGIKQSELRKVSLSFPPLAEQKAIAAVLGALDDKIELNRRTNATLEAMARALFQSWFIDFDPVRANLDRNQPSTRPVGHPSPTGRRDGDEGASGMDFDPVRAKLDDRQPEGMDAATAALFPEHFEHGEHDMLPIGWRLAVIDEVCAINAWTLGKNDDLETLEYVEISEVSRGNIANIATYPRGDEPSRARRRLRHGDTILSTVRPDRGSYFLALNPPENRVASTGFAVLTPTKVPWSFLHAALTLPEVSDHLGQMADGGAYPAVRPEVIGAMKVALPNEPKILEVFHRTCAPLFEQAVANRTQSRTLATLRDTLLPKLLSGQLSVDQLQN
jgi:type I restriction enzyme S subunit